MSTLAIAQTCVPIKTLNVLGNRNGQPLTLSSGRTFGKGNYRVISDLVLINGAYTLNPGAIFYVDGQATKTPLAGGGYQRQVTGYTITVGANASLVLDGATITASGSSPACSMWRGLVLNNGGTGPTGTYRLVMDNNSTISHALCGIDIADAYGGYATGATEYMITNSTFANNLTHVRDNTSHNGPNLSVIANSTFNSDPAQMHFPYDQTSAADQFYTYQALLVTPRDDANHNFRYVLDVHHNAINEAVYGIVNNIDDRAGVQIHDNRLFDIYAKGIWTVDKLAPPTPPATTAAISGNRVFLNTALTQPTEQIDPQATSYGLYTEETLHNYSNSFEQNYVRSDGTNPNLKALVGLGLAGAVDVRGNYLANLTEGIRSTAQDGALFDNYLAACDKGIVIPASGYSSYQTALGCNTFYGGSGTGGPGGPGTGTIQTAIEVQQGGYLNDQGSPSSPVANKFDGFVIEAIHNDGPPFDYWYATSSSQEALVTTATGGGNPVNLGMAIIPTGGWTNYCSSSRGATNGNGVNARGTLPSVATIAALADSVRRRLVPITRRRTYLYTVLNYYQNQNQLGALETWWSTLLLPNAEDYRTTGLTLLSAYDQQPAPAAAQRVLAALQPQALLNAEVAATLQYRLVRQHLPQTTPRLARADSTVLRALAWSGTSLAERAGQWLHYFYPRLRLPALPIQPARLTRAKAVAVGAVLGVAYPNPTPATARVPYQLPAGAAAAELQVINLLTGRIQLTLPLEINGGSGTEPQTVQLPQLPAGQYMYRLLVNGQPVAVPQRLVTLP